jgi:5'-nucleotidase
MTIVLTNDDGIDAPGIQALRQAVDQLGYQSIVVAPQDHLSGCSHQVTTGSPIRVEQRSATQYAIAGTPADCVRLALSHFYPEVQWVLSGINAGGNLGTDLYISGTVAAVREAALNHIPGIAISHYRQGKRPINWEWATQWTAKVLAELLPQSIPPGYFWNVNLPHPAEGQPDPKLVFCSPCTQPLPIQYKIEGDSFLYNASYASRKRDPGSDVEVCFSGQIAISQIRVSSFLPIE